MASPRTTFPIDLRDGAPDDHITGTRHIYRRLAWSSHRSVSLCVRGDRMTSDVALLSMFVIVTIQVNSNTCIATYFLTNMTVKRLD